TLPSRTTVREAAGKAVFSSSVTRPSITDQASGGRSITTSAAFSSKISGISILHLCAVIPPCMLPHGGQIVTTRYAVYHLATESSLWQYSRDCRIITDRIYRPNDPCAHLPAPSRRPSPTASNWEEL